MYKKILVPLENSPSDRAILGHIRGVAKHDAAELVLIHVADGFVARNQERMNLADSEEIERDRGYLSSIETELKGEGFPVQAVLAKGDPAEEILGAAERHGCDLIAMSTHGHGYLKDFLFGSVASTVRHRTDIPVLLLRAPRDG